VEGLRPVISEARDGPQRGAWQCALLNSTFFDIKDTEIDLKENIQTFPSKLGKHKALNILHVINVLSFFPIAIGVLLKVLQPFSLFLIIFFVYSFIYLRKAKKYKNIFNLTFVMVDGEYYFWPICLLIGLLLLG